MSIVKIINDEDVLIIDFSYFIIYRYHALHTWFKLSQTELKDDLYLEKFFKLSVCHLEKIIKKLSIKHNIILLGDCHRSEIWRMGFFPQYKESRNKYWEKNPISPNIFPLIKDKLIPFLISKYNFQYFCEETMEADDIAYCLKDKIQKTSFDKKIIFLTNDNDYLQLHDNMTDIVNLPSLNSIIKRAIDNSGKKSMLLKILSGDPSDNIYGVMSKKKAENILKNLSEDQCNLNDNNSELQKNLKNNKYDIDRIFLNQKLIDMSYIPDNLLDKFIIEIYNRS